MKKTAIPIPALFLLLFITGCTPKVKSSSEYDLSDRESFLCDSLGLDSTILGDIRKYNSSEIEPFHYSLSKMFENGKESEVDPKHLTGLVFNEENSKSYELVFNLKNDLRAKGYSIFLLENRFNIDNKPDVIGVLKTTDKYSILKQIATDGINYDITNDSLLSVIKGFDDKYSLELIGASGDWCEFVINKEPADWMTIANEVFQVCPDVVEQGTGSVEALRDEMMRTKRLYFWWD